MVVVADDLLDGCRGKEEFCPCCGGSPVGPVHTAAGLPRPCVDHQTKACCHHFIKVTDLA